MTRFQLATERFQFSWATATVLSAATQYTTGTGAIGPQSVAIGDLNGDGRPDLVVANASNKISLLLGNDAGGFQTQTPLSFSSGVLNNPSSVAVADLNGDGRLDLAVANFGDPNIQVGTMITVLLANDTGGFSRVNYTTGGPALAQSPLAT